MKDRKATSEKAWSQLGLFQNPYAFIDPDGSDAGEPIKTFTHEEKRAYLRKLENPYAYHSIFDESNDNDGGVPSPKIESPVQVPSGDTVMSKKELEDLLDEVLGLYQPFVARDDWSKVMTYRSEFLTEACRVPTNIKRMIQRLRELKFALLPGEKVEQNRAPADRIISELKKLLT